MGNRCIAVSWLLLLTGTAVSIFDSVAPIIVLPSEENCTNVPALKTEGRSIRRIAVALKMPRATVGQILSTRTGGVMKGARAFNIPERVLRVPRGVRLNHRTYLAAIRAVRSQL